ncbi:MAG TPA: glycosyltransferase [Polyangiaceae bacterium]|jgi:spore maturation protein CgeB|nr:glycosyltransferase [Polyangiaceae bacterium]
MKIVIFGLTVSSSWGNGHATLWRGLCRALAARGHKVSFFEQDAPYYRAERDLSQLESGSLVIYESWATVRSRALAELADADLAIVTSYCPDGREACDLVLQHARGKRVFYDLDTPVTLTALEAGEPPPYLPLYGLGGFDLVLSFTGGRALELVRERLGARRVAPLYGHVDPSLHQPPKPPFAARAELSYLGTYAADRQRALGELFFAPARARPSSRFLLAGAMYPSGAIDSSNIEHLSHVAPQEHPAFFAAARFTLNVTRASMAEFGYCPSGRLFEAAACGTPILSDWFEGLDAFFDPWRELIVVQRSEDVLDALSLSDAELAFRAASARERVLDQHTAAHRARELEDLVWSTELSARTVYRTMATAEA